MGVSLRNIVREPHRANSLSLAICHRRVYHGRPFLSAPANSPKPTISTPVRPPPRFALQICADRNACTSIWRLSLSLSLPYPPIGSSYSDVTSLSLDRPSLPGIVPIYIYIYMYRKSCRQSSARATTGVVDTVVSRMIRGRLIISSFSIPPSSFYFLFFLFFFLFKYGNYRYSLIERLLLYSKYVETRRNLCNWVERRSTLRLRVIRLFIREQFCIR